MEGRRGFRMAKKTKPSKPAPAAHELVLSVLGYREEGEWIALALEMDLRGTGETFEDALSDLHDHVAMQISFARFKQQPELISRPAEPQYWRLFENAMRDYLRNFAVGSFPKNPEYEARSLPLPEPHVIDALSPFRQANAEGV